MPNELTLNQYVTVGMSAKTIRNGMIVEVLFSEIYAVHLVRLLPEVKLLVTREKSINNGRRTESFHLLWLSTSWRWLT